MKLLLVEDNSILGDGTRKGLQHQGFNVDWVKTKEDAIVSLKTQKYDLVLLDIGLPDGSGLKVLSKLRSNQSNTPVLILTALNATSDRVRGLDMGADDYVVKPFDLDELSARIRALHRRHQGIIQSKLRFGDITLDPAAHMISQAGKPVDLGIKEFSILQLLFERAGRVVTKSDLEENLYGWGDEVSSNAIEVLIHRIRKKLGTDVVKTIRGVGYLAEKRNG